MGNLTTATAFIVFANILMWFCALAMLNINPDGTFCYNYEGSIIEQGVISSNSSVVDNIPGAEGGSVVSGSTNIFTDIFNSITNFLKTAPGIKYIYGVVTAPANILTCMGLPYEFGVGVGVVWYLISFLVLIAFMWGRD
jgi:hypothetical protein